MKLLIERILANKCLKWKDLADKTGKDKSNQRVSLFKPLGWLRIGEPLNELTKSEDKTLRIPRFNDYSQLRDAVAKFVNESALTHNCVGMSGILDEHGLFTLTYDGYDKYTLSLSDKDGKTKVFCYDRFEFATSWDLEGNAIWNIEEVTSEIIRDLECAMLDKFDT